MNILGRNHGTAHHKAVFGRRIEVLADALAKLIPADARVLASIKPSAIFGSTLRPCAR